MVDHYGFVGLGQMGGPMARNIGKHVPKLYVHDKAGVEPKKSSSNFVTVSKLSDLITLKYKALYDGEKALGEISEIKNIFVDFQKHLYLR